MRAPTFDLRTPSVAPNLAILSWTVAGGIAALAVGLAASRSPSAAIAVALGIGAAIAVIGRPKTILWILAASIFTELVRVEGTTISRVLAPIALLIVLVELFRDRASIRWGAPLVWAGAYSLWAFASGLWTTSVSGTTYLLGSLAIALVYMLAFSAMLESRRDLKHVLSVLALVSLLLGALSFPRVSQAFDLGQVIQAGRSQGGVGDPNSFAALQVLTLPLVIVLATEARKRWVQLGLYAGALVIIGSTMTSLSRGGLIALAVLLVLLLVIPFRFLFRSRRNKAIALLVVAFGVTAVSIRQASSLTSRIETIVGQGNPGAQQGSGRVELWRAAGTSIAERPWFGLGYGAFPSASNELLFRTPGVDLQNVTVHGNGQPVHNAYIESLAELGIAGLILYVGLLISTARALRRTAVRAYEVGEEFVAVVANALVLSLITWAITSFFLSVETSRALWILVGLSLALPKLLPPSRSRRTPSPLNGDNFIPRLG
jgi:putative inorganic carbon (hco3(-)) transporter